MERYIFSSIVAVLLLCSSLALAQIDPVTILPGTWDGWIETAAPGANPHRILVIESVTPKDDGGWIAKSKFSEAGAKPVLYDIDVSRQGEDIILDWTWGVARIPTQVKLIGPNKLEGYARPWQPRGGTGKSSVKFEKK